MNITVFISGIADPKWPVPELAQAREGGLIPEPQPRVLSPFDEAALEIALKLRDANAQAQITVAVFGSGADDRLARVVAGFRPDHLFNVDASKLPLWDMGRALAAFEALLAQSGTPPDLVLMGREFGDLDEGSLPAALAERLGIGFARLIQQVVMKDGELEMVREDASSEQCLILRAPVFATITNDRRNRLRQPLLKNVMAAKRAVIPATVPAISQDPPGVSLMAATRVEPVARQSACRMIDGPLDYCAAQLALELDPRRNAASS